MQKQQIQVTLELTERQDQHRLKIWLKAILRHYGLKCVALDVPMPVSGVVSNELAEPVPNTSSHSNIKTRSGEQNG